VLCLLPVFDSVEAGPAFLTADFAGRANLAIRCFNLPINFLSVLLKHMPTVIDHGGPEKAAPMIADGVNKKRDSGYPPALFLGGRRAPLPRGYWWRQLLCITK
jgi:hypothetical protein